MKFFKIFQIQEQKQSKLEEKLTKICQDSLNVTIPYMDLKNL